MIAWATRIAREHGHLGPITDADHPDGIATREQIKAHRRTRENK